WEYTPTIVNGAATAVMMRVTVNFSLASPAGGSTPRPQPAVVPASSWEATEPRGIQLLADGKIDEAIALYDAALQANPDSDGVHYRLGMAHRSMAIHIAADDPARSTSRREHLQTAATHLARAAALQGPYRPLALGELLLVY